MHRLENIAFKLAWISLTTIGVAILIFGLIVAIWPFSSDPSYSRAIGVAYIGMGLFGTVIPVTAYRRAERWAWFALWYYPIFWSAHVLGRLPPDKDHVHQVVFIALSVAGLLTPVKRVFQHERFSKVTN